MGPENQGWRQERTEATASIGLYLRYDARSTGLLLVEDNEGKVGLPSGGINPGEFLG